MATPFIRPDAEGKPKCGAEDHTSCIEGYACSAQEMLDAYAAGGSLHSIATLASCSIMSVERILKAHSAVLRGAGRPSKSTAHCLAVDHATCFDGGSALDYVKAYQQGMSIERLTEIAQRPMKQVRLVLRLHGVSIPTKRGAERTRGLQRVPGEERRQLPIEEVAQRYATGLSLKALAWHYKTSSALLRARLEKAGIEIRPRGRKAGRFPRNMRRFSWILAKDGQLQSKKLWLHEFAKSLIGRELTPHEAVHHIDGNRENEAEVNLAVLLQEHHLRFHGLCGPHAPSRALLHRYCRETSPFYWTLKP